MKFTIERAHLLKSLGHVQSVVEKRGTIAVLSNVKIDAKGSAVSLTATDMDLAMMDKSDASVDEEGSTTVPAHMFYDIVRKLPDGAQIEVATNEEATKVSVKSGQSKFSLGCLPVDEFPVMADEELPHSFSLPSAECKSLTHKPSFAISTEETRYYLNGIYLHVAGEGDKVLRAVATDGHRLARIEVGLPAGAGDIPGVIVPRKAIYELNKLLDEGEGDVSISLSANKIRFAYGHATLVSKLIDGSFPDYQRVVPEGNDKLMEINCKSLKEAVDRVSVISTEKSRAVKLHMDNGKLTLSVAAPDHGEATEQVDISYSSDPIEIGFNSRYLLDMLGEIEGETAQFMFNDSASPALVRDTADVAALYVIMPMRV